MSFKSKFFFCFSVIFASQFLFSKIAFSKPNIIILATGGTIAGSGKSSSEAAYTSSQISIEQIIVNIPELTNIANVSGEQFSQIASQNSDNDFLLKLAKRINEILAKSDVDGIVITHGTDTLEETAYFLHLTIKSKKPVIIVGSMRSSTSISADGPLNLYNAVGVCADKNSKAKGVLVVLNDEIYSARDVTKIHTSNVDAFKAANFGAIGNVNYGKAMFYYEPLRLHSFKSAFNINKINDLPKVEIIYVYSNHDSSIVDYLTQNKVSGIVIAGVGDGNFNDETLKKLSTASKNGIIIARSSRVGNGFIIPNSEINDDKNFFVSADNLNPQKARILLMLSLTKTKNYQQIQDYFWSY
jgi:L-asparaginase